MTILEKIKLLEKYIAADASSIDPVMELAIEKLLKREASRINELKQRLIVQKTEFEEKYGLSSEEFCSRYEKGILGDDIDYIEWSATVDMLSGIEKRLSLLRKEASMKNQGSLENFSFSSGCDFAVTLASLPP